MYIVQLLLLAFCACVLLMSNQRESRSRTTRGERVDYAALNGGGNARRSRSLEEVRALAANRRSVFRAASAQRRQETPSRAPDQADRLRARIRRQADRDVPDPANSDDEQNIDLPAVNLPLSDSDDDIPFPRIPARPDIPARRPRIDPDMRRRALAAVTAAATRIRQTAAQVIVAAGTALPNTRVVNRMRRVAVNTNPSFNHNFDEARATGREKPSGRLSLEFGGYVDYGLFNCVECGVECGVWSVDCGLLTVEWNVECGVWSVCSVECRM
jgi:hypothetical protein